VGTCRRSTGWNSARLNIIFDKSKTISPSEVLQRNYYYAFGMEIDGNWDNVSTPVRNAYLYNGKELHNWNGLNWSDYGARWYMPEIGRFTGVDPIADQYPHVSVYNYAENEPIGHIDLWGLQKAKPIGAGNYRASVNLRYIGFGLRHPNAIARIGIYKRGSNNISNELRG